MEKEFDRIDKESIKFLEENPQFSGIIRSWINIGDSEVRFLFNAQNRPELRKKSNFRKNEALQMIDSLQEMSKLSNIRTQREVVFRRETAYPIRQPIFDQYLPFSVTTRPEEDMPGCFGDKVYEVVVPPGIPIFFLSAIDILKGMELEETEEEYLVWGKTSLVNGKIVVSPI